MDEQKFTGESLNLSFPAVQKQQKTNGQDGHVESPAVSGDIVDTSWDFQPLTFPSFADEIDQKGPRHAAPKRGMRGAKDSGGEHADESTATHDDESGSTPGQAVPNAVFLPSTPFETVQHDDERNGQASGDDAQQTAVLTSRQSLVGTDDGQTAKESSAAAAGMDSVEKASRRSRQSSKSGNSHGSKGKRHTVVIALIAIVAVIAIAVGVVVLWRAGQASRHEAAVNDCAKVSEQYNSAKKDLDKALASARNLQSVSESQVGDGKTIQQLKQQLELAKQFSSAPSCAAKQSTPVLQTNAKAMNEQIGDMTDSTKSLRKAVNAVSSSKAVKDLQTLKDAVATAQKLMDSSQGMVSDESTRTALQEAIDAANKLISKNSSDDAAITDAISALNSASDEVNDSMSSATSQSQSGNGYDADSSTSGTYGYNTYGYGYGNGTYGDQNQYYNANTGNGTTGVQNSNGGNSNNSTGNNSGSTTGTNSGQNGNQNGNANGNGSNSGSSSGTGTNSSQSSGNSQ